MYKVTITQTRTVEIPIEASCEDEALIIAATEYRDNRHSALSTDSDWTSVSVNISCEKLPEPCKGVHSREYY